MRHIEWLLPAAEVRSSNPDISKFLFGSLFFLHSIETTKITKKRPGFKKNVLHYLSLPEMHIYISLSLSLFLAPFQLICLTWWASLTHSHRQIPGFQSFGEMGLDGQAEGFLYLAFRRSKTFKQEFFFVEILFCCFIKKAPMPFWCPHQANYEIK